MLRLDSTLRKLQIVLAGAITTNQLPVVVCFSDKTSTTYNGGTTVSNTNSTTAVDICAAPGAATIRDIDSITVQNADTAAATVTIRYNDNGTTYSIFKCTLSVGDQIIYTHGQGWKVLDSSGALKSLSSDTVTLAGAQTLTNKTIALGSNTVSGTKAQFDAACTDDDFAFRGTAQAFSQKQTFSAGAEVTGGVLGYGAGNGGTVVQATSRATAVTINKPSGKITMFSAAGSTSIGSFLVNNNTVTENDTISVDVQGGYSNIYEAKAMAIGNGAFFIIFYSISGTAVDAPVLNFNVHKGSAS